MRASLRSFKMQGQWENYMQSDGCKDQSRRCFCKKGVSQNNQLITVTKSLPAWAVFKNNLKCLWKSSVYWSCSPVTKMELFNSLFFQDFRNSCEIPVLWDLSHELFVIIGYYYKVFICEQYEKLTIVKSQLTRSLFKARKRYSRYF